MIEHDKLKCLNITLFENDILSSVICNNLYVVTFAKIKYFTHFLLSGLINGSEMEIMSKEKCNTRFCRGEPTICLKGIWLCESCWDKHCEEGV